MADTFIQKNTTSESSVRLAIITKVYDADTLDDYSAAKFYGYVEISWLDGFGNVNRPIRACFPHYSPYIGSCIMTMPSVGDTVVCAMRYNDYPIIISYLPDYSSEAVYHYLNDYTIGNAATFPPLYSGETLIRGPKSQDIFLGKDGSIKLTTKNIYNTNANDHTQEDNNTEAELSISSVKTASGEIATGKDGDALVLRSKYCNQHTITEYLTASSGKLTTTNEYFKIKYIFLVTKTSATYIESILKAGTDYIEESSTSISLLTNTADNTLFKVIYYSESILYTNDVSANGNSDIIANKYRIFTNQSSLIVGEDGQVYINIDKIDNYVTETATTVANEIINRALSNLKFAVGDEESYTETFTITETLNTDITLTNTPVYNISSVVGTYIGDDNYTFLSGVDYELNQAKTGLRFINNRVPDNNTILTITYTKFVQNNELFISSDLIKLGNKDTTRLSMTSDGANFQVASGKTVKLGASNLERAVVCCDPNLTEITDISQLHIEKSVTV